MNATPAGDGIDATLVTALKPYLETRNLLIAVSGGPDSTALMHAAARSGAAHPIQVATVDHRLRAEGGVEARNVGITARALGLRHHILSWDGDKPSRGYSSRRTPGALRPPGGMRDGDRRGHNTDGPYG